MSESQGLYRRGVPRPLWVVCGIPHLVYLRGSRFPHAGESGEPDLVRGAAVLSARPECPIRQLVRVVAVLAGEIGRADVVRPRGRPGRERE